jgi:NAD(P)-dependent dehydrogenase (short-subunit alcohol dehydrogenase family)
MTTRFLEGKTALVTGSSAGLGYAMAQALAGAGCRVVLHGLETAEAVEPARAALAEQARHGGGVCPRRRLGCWRHREPDGEHTWPVRRRRYPCQQRGRTAFFADRVVSDRPLESGSGGQCVGGVSHGSTGVAGDAAQGLGAHCQHDLGVWHAGYH